MAFSWLVLYAGLGLWFGRLDNPATLSHLDTSAIIQITSVIFALFTISIKLLNGIGLNNFRGPFLLIGLYAIWGVLTSPLSPVPALSAFKAGSLFIVVLIAIVAITIAGRKDAGRIFLNTAYLYLGTLVLLSLIGGILFPEITHRPNKGLFKMMLVGWPALNSNSLSFVAATISLVGFRRFFDSRLLSNKLFYFGAFTSGFCVLLLAQGRTSIVGFFLGALFLTFTVKRMRWIRGWFIISGFIILSVFLLTGSAGDWLDTLETYLRRGSDDEALTSLSGRTDIWKSGWDIFLSSPIVGYGFYSAEKLGIAAHNAYLLVLINSGIIGFTLWVGYVYWGFFGAAKDILTSKFKHNQDKQGFAAETASILIVLLLRTITGSDLTTHHYSTMILISYLIWREIEKSTAKPTRKVYAVKEKSPNYAHKINN